MRTNAKSLKRNDGDRKGILIAPSQLPRFFQSPNLFHCGIFPQCLERMSASGQDLAARMESRHSRLYERNKTTKFRKLYSLSGSKVIRGVSFRNAPPQNF